MFALVEFRSNLIKEFSDIEPSIENGFYVIGNSMLAYTEASNLYIVEEVSKPEDFLVDKYMFVNGQVVANPDWVEAEREP